MNIDIIDAIGQLCHNEKISSILRFCQFKTIEDFSNFSDLIVDKIEKYLQLRCPLMLREERQMYLNESDIDYPQEFIFTPGLRNRLLKAVETVEKLYGKNSFQMTNNSIRNDRFNDSAKSQLSVLKPINQNVISNNVNNNPKSDSFTQSIDIPLLPNRKWPSSPNMVTVGQMRIDLHMYYNDIAENLNASFTQLKIVPKVDFDLEFHFNENDFKQSYAFYICHICGNKKLKFKFTKNLGVLFGNIKSHVRIHQDHKPEEGLSAKESRVRTSRMELDKDFIYDRSL